MKRKKLFYTLILLLIFISSILIYLIVDHIHENRIYLSLGNTGQDIVVLKSILNLDSINNDVFDEQTRQSLIDWQKKYSSSHPKNKSLKADGNVRKSTIISLGLTLDSNGKIIQDKQYLSYFEKAYSKGYEGYIDIPSNISSLIPKIPVKFDGNKLFVYNIETQIPNAKIIDTKMYSTPDNIKKSLLSSKTGTTENSKLLRIFPEEENYLKYITFSNTLSIQKYKIDKIDKVFLKRLAAFLRNNNKKLTISEGFRTYNDQQILYRSFPTFAILPGTSWHEYCVAIDILDSNIQSCIWFKTLYKNSKTDQQTSLLKYGLFKPYTPGNKEEIMKNSFKSDDLIPPEDWHIQPIETRYDPDQSSYRDKVEKK